MTVAFDAITSAQVSSGGSWQFTHTPVGAPGGVLLVITSDTITDDIASVTYGGVAMSEVALSPATVSGEPLAVHAFFLGGGAVPAGQQTVAITSNGLTSNVFYCELLSFTTSRNATIIDTSSASGVGADPHVTLSLASKEAYCVLGWGNGHFDVRNLSPDSGWTSRRETDAGARGHGLYTYNTIGTTDVSCGMTAASDDYVLLAIAVGEVDPPAANTGTLAATESGSDTAYFFNPRIGDLDVTEAGADTCAVAGEVYTPNPLAISSPDRGTLDLANCSITPNGDTPTFAVKCIAPNDSGILTALTMYGQVDGVRAKTPLFELSRTDFNPAAFKSGYKFFYSYDRITWNTFDNFSSTASTYFFSNNSAFSGDTVYFCSQKPWLYEDTLTWIESLESSGFITETPSSSGNGYVFNTRSSTIDDGGDTIPVSDLYSFKVSSGSGNAPDGAPKRKVVLVSGIHAAEDIGNHQLKGALAFLVSADSKAATLRSWFDFYVYPLVATAGRRGGANREDYEAGLADVDVNREWDGTRLETVNKHKTAISSDVGGVATVMLDFHGTWLDPFTFHYVRDLSTLSVWEAAIQVYRPSLSVDVTETIGTSTWWGDTSLGADFAVVSERDMLAPWTSDIETYGADALRALSDLAASGYWSVGGGANTGTLAATEVGSDTAALTGILVNGAALAAREALAVAHPDGDTTAGTWVPSSGSVLYAMLAEDIPDDGTYISGQSTVSSVSLSDLSAPPPDTLHKVGFRAACPTGGGWLAVTLYQGDTSIASKSWVGEITPDFRDYEYFLTSAEVAAITDYTALRLQFWTIVSGPVQVSWAEVALFAAIDTVASSGTVSVQGVLAAAETGSDIAAFATWGRKAAASAVLQKTFVAATDASAVLSRIYAKFVDSSAIIEASPLTADWDSDTKAWDDDALAWDAVLNGVIVNSAALLQKTLVTLANAAATLQKTLAVSASGSAALRQAFARAASANATIGAEFVKSANSNALLLLVSEMTLSASGVVRAALLKTAVSNAILVIPGQQLQTTNASAVLQRTFGLSALSSAVLGRTRTQTAEMSAVVLQFSTKTANANAIVFLETPHVHTDVNAILQKNILTSSGADAIISVSGWVDDPSHAPASWTPDSEVTDGWSHQDAISNPWTST